MTQTVFRLAVVVDHDDVPADDLVKFLTAELEGATLLRALQPGEAGAVVEEVLSIEAVGRASPGAAA